MCGFAGIFRFDEGPVDTARLRAARQRLLCRGPDDQGDYVRGGIGLTHTRLAVIDPDDGGQPMQLAAGGEHGELVVAFNGMIYNHREMRRRLTQQGHEFTTDHADTEVLLHGYRQWGPEVLRHLEGMFAFAIYDAGLGRVFIARDRIGKKPLYLHHGERSFSFASTPAALMSLLDHQPVMDNAALTHYLAFGYTRNTGPLKDIDELPPAHHMTIHRDGRREVACYFRPPPLSKTMTTKGVEDAIDRLLRDAVVSRLDSDVPIGCFLSGGIDSSLIAAMAQDELKSRGQTLKTFSVAMPDAKYDESPHARSVAERLGTEHVELRAEPDFEADLLFLTRTMGHPLGDSSILPTYWLSRETRKHVTVALSGDGGDELFAGYDRYRAMRMLRRHRIWLRSIPRGLLRGGEQKNLSVRLRRLVDAAAHEEPFLQYNSMVRILDDVALGSLEVNRDSIASLNEVLRDTTRQVLEDSSQANRHDPADIARRIDLHTYLPFDLLRKVDRASMAVALEVRCPFLDTSVVDLASHLPAPLLMPGGKAKGLLRRVAGRYLPKSITERKKMGFAIPLGEWFRSFQLPVLTRWLLDEPHLTSLGLDREGIELLVHQHLDGQADHAQRLFTLMSLSMWKAWLDEKGD